MIAFADGMPLVKLNDGRLTAFQRDWILRGLAKAAHKAGYSKWWMAEVIVDTLTFHLTRQFEASAITVPQLVKAINEVLQVTGYAEVSLYFDPGQPGEQLNLAELAHQAGNGYELVFFNQLRDRLRALIGTGASELRIVGLSSCVKQLSSRKSWSRKCDDLREEIVSFVRTQTLAAPATARELSVQVR